MTKQYKPIRVTNSVLDSLPNQCGQVIYVDTQLSQLGVLVHHLLRLCLGKSF